MAAFSSKKSVSFEDQPFKKRGNNRFKKRGNKNFSRFYLCCQSKNARNNDYEINHRKWIEVSAGDIPDEKKYVIWKEQGVSTESVTKKLEALKMQNIYCIDHEKNWTFVKIVNAMDVNEKLKEFEYKEQPRSTSQRGKRGIRRGPKNKF